MWKSGVSVSYGHISSFILHCVDVLLIVYRRYKLNGIYFDEQNLYNCINIKGLCPTAFNEEDRLVFEILLVNIGFASEPNLTNCRLIQFPQDCHYSFFMPPHREVHLDLPLFVRPSEFF